MIVKQPNFLAILVLLVTLATFISTTATAASAPYVTDKTTGMVFVRVPGGTFQMGDHTGNDTDALPVREVTVKSFYMGKYEVTFDEFDRYCEENNIDKPSDYGFGREKRPVVGITWGEAAAFAKWLSEKSGQTYRLPSEAEWEYAARSGGLKITYPWGKALNKNVANCRGCGSSFDGKMTAPVGSFSANAYGLHDMGGNVYEWLLDTEHRNYDGAPTDGSAWIDDKAKDTRMTRSGSWDTRTSDLTTWVRCWDHIDLRSNNIGFRLVLEQ